MTSSIAVIDSDLKGFQSLKTVISNPKAIDDNLSRLLCNTNKKFTKTKVTIEKLINDLENFSLQEIYSTSEEYLLKIFSLIRKQENSNKQLLGSVALAPLYDVVVLSNFIIKIMQEFIEKNYTDFPIEITGYENGKEETITLTVMESLEHLSQLLLGQVISLQENKLFNKHVTGTDELYFITETTFAELENSSKEFIRVVNSILETHRINNTTPTEEINPILLQLSETTSKNISHLFNELIKCTWKLLQKAVLFDLNLLKQSCK